MRNSSGQSRRDISAASVIGANVDLASALHVTRAIAVEVKFLHDDLAAVTLDGELLARPPIELWPEVVCRGKVPTDVEELLLRRLQVRGASK
jgi:hypothetical protein